MARRILWMFAVAVMAVLHCARAQLQGIFETAAALENARGSVAKPSSLKAAYYSSRILDALKSKEYVCNCKALAGLFSKEMQALEVFYGLSAAKACRCADIKASEKQTAMVKKALQVRAETFHRSEYPNSALTNIDPPPPTPP